VLGGNLDLTTSGISVTTNSTTLTLEGGTIDSNGVNALAALASNTKSLTIAGTATKISTTAASFSNTGTLTVDKGDSLTATALTQISGGTLSGGTYVLAGNLDLTTSGISIATNSATLTLEGGTIESGTANALAGFDSNTSTGTFTLAGNAVLTTAAANFTDAGTLDVAKGSTLTVGGTGNSYNQTAGKTTIDGTLAGITGATVTGGEILGAGTTKGNLSVGNASGTAATINVGDSGVAGLLSITGKYTQLATGAMTGTINGTAAGTGYSQLKVTGAAALAGTINFTVTTAFQASLTLGEKFTVLSAGSVAGTFSNTTIAINSTLEFTVSYTSTGVVLTVAAAPTTASTKPEVAAAVKSKSPVVISGLRRPSSTGKFAAGKTLRRVAIAEWEYSNARLPSASELNSLRSWERIPAVHAWPLAAAPTPRPSNETLTPSQPELGLWRTREIRPVETPLAGRTGLSNIRREPVRILSPMLLTRAPR